MFDSDRYTYSLDKSLTLKPFSDDQFELAADRTYWNFRSAFGGWVSAATLAAVEQNPAFRGQLLSKDIRFMAPVEAETLRFVVEHLAKKRTTDFWRVSVTDASDTSKLLAAADIVTGKKRHSDLSFEPIPPAEMSIDAGGRLEASDMTPRWFSRFEQILTHGVPFKANDTPKSIVLIREADQRPLDAKGLVAIADTPMPRVFFVSEQPRMSSTLSLSTHIYASDEEIKQTGVEFLTLTANSAVIRHSTLNQEVRIYRRDGLLLATSYQTAIFR